MIARHESLEKTQPIANRESVIAQPEHSPYEVEHQIEQLEATFEAALREYQSTLKFDPTLGEPVYLDTQEQDESEGQFLSPELIGKLFPEVQSKEKNLEAAVRFFAFVHAVEHARTGGKHQPNWPQTETALYLFAHPHQREVQRVEMGTGEGKTFAIGLVALWRALRGEDVMVHTDKDGNVGQNLNSLSPLYDLFGVAHGRALFSALSSPQEYQEYFMRTDEFPAFAQALKEGREYIPQPRIRYGVWSQFIHEWLQLRLMASKLEHQLAGKTQVQQLSDGTSIPLTAQQRRALETELLWIRTLQKTHAIVGDEGDQYIDLEANNVVLSQEVEDVIGTVVLQPTAALRLQPSHQSIQVADVKDGHEYEVMEVVTFSFGGAKGAARGRESDTWYRLRTPEDTQKHIYVSHEEIKKYEEAPPNPEVVRMQLAWSVFQAQLRGGQNFERIADALGQDEETVHELYAMHKKRASEGEQLDDDHYVTTEARSQVNFDRMYRSSLIDVVTNPEAVVNLLDTYIKHRDAFPTANREFSNGMLKDVRIALKQSVVGDAIHWEQFASLLPLPRRSELADFFSIKYPIFDFRHVYTKEIERVVQRSSEFVTQAELDLIQHALAEELPEFQKLLGVSRLIAITDQVWLDVFNSYHGALVRTEELIEGNNYQRIRQKRHWPDGRIEEKVLIRVIGENREPQPGKEFDDAVQAFLHLRHGMPFPKPKATTASISPALWYQMMAAEGTDVTSISGSQDDPDFIAESTGQGLTEVLPTRILPDRDTKQAEIVKYVLAHRDRPILLCAQDIDELQALADQLQEHLGPKNMVMLDAAHASQANTLVPELEPGKVVLLQISARGQDFGRMMQSEDGDVTHTFENGLIISTTALSNQHLQTQLYGRLGGKRPSGQIVTFTSLEDTVMQERYLYRPQLREEQEQRFATLEQQYQALRAKAREHIAARGLADTEWPAEATTAIAELDTWLERDERDHPLWVQLLIDGDALPAQYRAAASELRAQCRRFFSLYDELAKTHTKAIEYQQQLNLTELYEHRRTQLIIDATVEKVWELLMSTDESTPLGQAAAHMTFKEKQLLADYIFTEAPLLYPLSVKDINSSGLTEGSQRSNDERKQQRFFTDLVEMVRQAAIHERLRGSYATIRKSLPDAQLPKELDRLSAWLAEYKMRNQRKSFFNRQRQVLARTEPEFPIPRKLRLDPHVLTTLQEIAQDYYDLTHQTQTGTLLRNLGLS